MLRTWPDVELVDEATNGEEAVQLVAEHLPDVVLMDLYMPRLDGLAATRVIKQNWPQVNVVILTVQTTRRGEALAAGADDFVLKGAPFNRLSDALHPSSIARNQL